MLKLRSPPDSCLGLRHGLGFSLGHFQVGSQGYRRSVYLLEALLEALYTLNSPPVVSVNLESRHGLSLGFLLNKGTSWGPFL